MGRRSTYTDAIAEKICRRLIEGESLVDICASKDMPPVSTVYDWLARGGDFSEKYARARDSQADTFADAIVSVARDTGKTPDDRRLEIDALKWSAGKRKPKQYGDKTVVSGDSENPLSVRQTIDASGLSDSALAELLNARLAASDE